MNCCINNKSCHVLFYLWIFKSFILENWCAFARPSHWSIPLLRQRVQRGSSQQNKDYKHTAPSNFNIKNTLQWYLEGVVSTNISTFHYIVAALKFDMCKTYETEQYFIYSIFTGSERRTRRRAVVGRSFQMLATRMAPYSCPAVRNMGTTTESLTLRGKFYL